MVDAWCLREIGVSCCLEINDRYKRSNGDRGAERQPENVAIERLRDSKGRDLSTRGLPPSRGQERDGQLGVENRRKSKKSYLRQSKLKIYSPERSRRRFALPSVDFVDDARKEFVRLKAAGDYCTVVCSHIVRMDSREFVHARLEKQHKRSVDPLSLWQGEPTQGFLSRVETRKVHRA